MDSGVASVSQEKFLTSSLKAGRGEANKFLRNELRCKSEKSIVTPFEERNVFSNLYRALFLLCPVKSRRGALNRCSEMNQNAKVKNNFLHFLKKGVSFS